MHIYALCRSHQCLTLPSGVASPLQWVEHDQLAAVVEPELQLDDLQQDDDRLLHAVLVHDRVIRELFQQTTVLPLRFTAFLSLDELHADLQGNQPQYLETLERLDGKAELTLKFAPHDLAEQPIAPELKGKDYFLAKKRQHQVQQQQREGQVQELNEVIQAIAQNYTIATQADSHQVHVLLNQHELAPFQAQLQQIMATVHHWSCAISDVLPPFHFI